MNLKTLEKIIENKLDVKHYHLLMSIKNKEDFNLLKNIELNANLKALEKKNFIVKINNEYICLNNCEQILNKINNTNITIINNITNVNFDVFVDKLYENLKQKIFLITYKYNYKNPSGKMLLPSKEELKERIISFYKKFKNNFSYIEIENSLLNYVENVINKNIKYPMRLVFYIWNEKHNGLTSEMLENMLENKEEINIKTETKLNKELF